MWILIRQNLPATGVDLGDGNFKSLSAPPYASIHWATPWTDTTILQSQRKREAMFWGERNKVGRKTTWELAEDKQADETWLYMPTALGLEANWAGAVRLRWEGEDLRVFPHEFTPLDSDAMRMFVLGAGVDEPSHELVTGEVPELTLLKGMLESDLSFQYD